MDEILNKAAAVRLAVFDVDGVLTDGRLILGSGGEEHKSFHVHDGLGLVLLQKADIRVAVISARASPVVAERMASLGIEYVYQGREDKRETLDGLMRDLGIAPAQTMYVGDDLLDLPAMKAVGLAVAVADAHPFVAEHADWVTRRDGGRGAVREACELLLRGQGRLDRMYREYLG
ncbi:MAG: HAD-IIIA family hydrolase [Gammaproteobacteria bacterium]|jgi:3-deoxy-D-manno-octulosonate 8-phosphate phosphatase (KDO 8-P phosphatase)